MSSTAGPPPELEAVFGATSSDLAAMLRALRLLILELAGSDQAIGKIEETLKWGEPAFLTSKPKSGTTIRIAPHKGSQEVCGLYVHCQTDLVARWRELYGDVLDFEGNRAILLPVAEKLPEQPLRHCIAMALTYHSAKAV